MKKKRIYKLAVGLIIMIIIVASSVYVIGRKGKMIEEKKICQAEEAEETVEATENANSEEKAKALPTIPESWDQTKVTPVLSEDNIYVPVPIGFTASGAEGEHTVNTGFVIYEGTGEVTDENAWTESINRNQFVWVPVENASERIYERNSTTGKIKSRLWNGNDAINNNDNDTKAEPGLVSSSLRVNKNYKGETVSRDIEYKEIEIEYRNTLNSIEKYGGFYIGRYETGRLNSEKPTVARMKLTSNQNRDSFYTLHNRMSNICSNPNIEINMIWGCLWDETLHWLSDTNAKNYGRGNYYKSTFMYIDSQGIEETKKANTAWQILSGSAEYANSNNIYDLAGNVWEWTLEGGSGYSGACRVLRGGGYKNNMYSKGVFSRFSHSHSSFHKYDGDPPAYFDTSEVGVRAFFYIK